MAHGDGTVKLISDPGKPERYEESVSLGWDCEAGGSEARWRSSTSLSQVPIRAQLLNSRRPPSVVVRDLAHPVRTDRRRPYVKKVEFCGNFPPCRSDATRAVFYHAWSKVYCLSLSLLEGQQNSSVLAEGPNGCAAIRKRPQGLAWRRQL